MTPMNSSRINATPKPAAIFFPMVMWPSRSAVPCKNLNADRLCRARLFAVFALIDEQLPIAEQDGAIEHDQRRIRDSAQEAASSGAHRTRGFEQRATLQASDLQHL